MYKKREIGKNGHEVKDMENKNNIQKADKKDNKQVKLKEEAKVGLVVSLSAALFFGGVITIASLQKGPRTGVSVNPSTSEPIGDVSTPTSDDPVIVVPDPMKEVVERPFSADLSIARTFYDSTDDAETRMTALVNLPGEEGTYSKSFGVDFKAATQFEVEASFSGVVIRKANDSIYGNVIHIKHDSGVVGVYASLGAMLVNEGQTVKQDDIIATSGESIYTSGFGQSLHFELKDADNLHVNPNKAFGTLVKNI